MYKIGLTAMTHDKHNRIMVINAGSSSLRLALFERKDKQLHELCTQHFATDTTQRTAQLQQFVRENRVDATVLVAHRVVHGGARFKSATIIDDTVRHHIDELAPLAPLHNPAALALINEVETLLTPAVKQIALFDTAFFHDLPAVARNYAIDAGVSEQHAIYRYGFHGLAHEYMWRQWCEMTGNHTGHGRLLTLQLGSGCSIAAIQDGRALDTSMGFSPLEGLVMATRSGDLDPGILLYLQNTAGYSIDELDDLLNKRSGLLGVSQRSADMRELLAATDPQSILALEMYVYRLRKYLGSYLTVLSGADGIVFGGGVGENSAEIRARVLEGLSWCGVKLDTAANNAKLGFDGCISGPQSQIPVWTIKVREELYIAQQVSSLLDNQTSAR